MTPDEAIANVQSELQRLGYYSGSIDGVLGPATGTHYAAIKMIVGLQ